MICRCPQGCQPLVPAHETTLTVETGANGKPYYICVVCYWRGTPRKSEFNSDFVFNSIHKLNRAQRRVQKDAILHAIGIHCGLLKKKRSQRLPIILSQEERDRVVYFLRQFLVNQGLEIEVRP